MKERYIVQPSREKEGYLVCTDTQEGLVCIFKRHDFNNDQKFTLLDSNAELLRKLSPAQLARIINEMGSWLRDNRYEDVF